MNRKLGTAFLFSTLVAGSAFGARLPSPRDDEDTTPPVQCPEPAPLPEDPVELPAPAEDFDAITESTFRYFTVTRDCHKLTQWQSMRNGVGVRYLVFIGDEFTCNGQVFVVARVSGSSIANVYRKSDLILKTQKPE